MNNRTNAQDNREGKNKAKNQTEEEILVKLEKLWIKISHQNNFIDEINDLLDSKEYSLALNQLQENQEDLFHYCSKSSKYQTYFSQLSQPTKLATQKCEKIIAKIDVQTHKLKAMLEEAKEKAQKLKVKYHYKQMNRQSNDRDLFNYIEKHCYEERKVIAIETAEEAKRVNESLNKLRAEIKTITRSVPFCDDLADHVIEHFPNVSIEENDLEQELKPGDEDIDNQLPTTLTTKKKWLVIVMAIVITVAVILAIILSLTLH